ncbi:hypothetical protein Tsubulata_026300 [Turnera subulata]|uniref:F-box domain-containing protein n=1 Tax=Turnera subulata TaxID=218843 RepID=A0A9Q0G8A6_9ROSI|nr:hypothetical protein Tsubulata_026300 [Turnera subulata]
MGGGGDHISELPDDILAIILSFLSIRDAVRTRVLSRRWRYLYTRRSLLHFDASSVFGDGEDNVVKYSSGEELRSIFVTAVDQAFLHCKGLKIRTLKVHYGLRNDYFCHIDRWVESSIAMEAETIDFNFSFLPQYCESYNFPCHLLPIGKDSSRFKHLSLSGCMLRIPPAYTSRLNCLSTLDLSHVPLRDSGLESIISGCSSLTWLRLINCSLPMTLCLNGQLLSLKVLIVEDVLRDVQMISLNLECFEFSGHAQNFTFDDVPYLNKVLLTLPNASLKSSSICSTLAMGTPGLQLLSLSLGIEMLPLPPSSTRFSCLKQLILFIMVSTNLDLLAITHILNASPVLEILQLKLGQGSNGGQREKREYSSHQYLHLKEVEIKRFRDQWNEMELAIYLLRNACVLQRMVVEVAENHRMEDLKERVGNTLQKEKINPHTELIVI